jgi:hypothetical protein
LEDSVANDYLLVNAPRPPIDIPIEVAAQLAPRRGSCRDALEAT